MKLLLYCSKSKSTLYNVLGKYITTEYMGKDFMQDGIKDPKLNGKIVAECDFEIEDIKKLNYDCMLLTKTLDTEELTNKSCADYFELVDYLKPNWRKEDDLQNLDTVGYAIHIKNLHIFDKPKELSEVYKIEGVGGMLFTKTLTNAPQNMMRVSINHWYYAAYNTDDIRILISIRPEWLCKILNGEKTIEVRKKVLKGMLK